MKQTIRNLAIGTAIGIASLLPYAHADEAKIKALENQKATIEAQIEEAKIQDAAEKAAEEQSKAQENNRLMSVRTRVEYTSHGKDNLIKSTLGISPGTSDPNSPFLKFDGRFREIEQRGTVNGANYEDHQLQLNLPLKKLGIGGNLFLYRESISNQAQKKGTESTILGADYLLKTDKLTLELMADERTDNGWALVDKKLVFPKTLTGLSEDKSWAYTQRVNTSSTSQHIGAYADYKVLDDKVIVGAGFDRVTTGNSVENDFLVKTRIFIGDNDQVGLGFHSSNDGSTTTNTIAGMYGHYGKNIKVGTRLLGFYSWNDQLDEQSLSLRLRINQNPTYHKDFAFDWPTNNRIIDGGQFTKNLGALPFDLENYDPHYHSSSGAFGQLGIDMANHQGIASGNMGIEAGYAWAPAKNSKIALSGTYTHNFSEKPNENTDNVGIKLYAQRKNWELYLKGSETLGNNATPKASIGMQYQFGVPKPHRN